MLENLLRQWFDHLYYVRFDGARMRVSTPKAGIVFDAEPLMAIEVSPKGKPKPVAIGNEAKSAIPAAGCTIQLINAYAHPRVGVGDFTAADLFLKAVFRRIGKGRWFAPSPVVIMHPLYPFKNDLTQVERRVLAELAMGAGASKVMLWTGHELSDDELLTFKESVGA